MKNRMQDDTRTGVFRPAYRPAYRLLAINPSRCARTRTGVRVEMLEIPSWVKPHSATSCLFRLTPLDDPPGSSFGLTPGTPGTRDTRVTRVSLSDSLYKPTQFFSHVHYLRQSAAGTTFS